MKITSIEQISTGKRLTDLLKERNMTQEQLHDQLEHLFPNGKGASIQSISAWMNNKSKIRNNTMILLANVLDVDVEYLQCKQVEQRKPQFQNCELSDSSTLELQRIREAAKLHDYFEAIGYKIEDVLEGKTEAGDIAEYQFIEGNKLYTVEDTVCEPTEHIQIITCNDGSTIEVQSIDVDKIVDRIKDFTVFQFEQLKGKR